MKPSVYKIIMDVFLLLLVIIPTLILHTMGKPFYKGFFCDDQNLMYDYKRSTFRTTYLLLYTVFIPLGFILLVEYLIIGTLNQELEKKERLSNWFGNVYRYYGIYFFGYAVCILIVYVFKFTFGGLRPHFMDVCNPDFTKCTPGTYVTKEVCRSQGGDLRLLREAHLSFLSAHAAFSAYGMFYLIFYLQFRFCFTYSLLLKPFLQLYMFALALYTALSRVSDYKHHWFDVLAGFILGIVVSICFAFWVARISMSAVPCMDPVEQKMRDLQMLKYRQIHRQYHKHLKGKF